MPLAAANNSVSDFELLGRVYLDPFLFERPVFWIGLYERLDRQAVRRVFRGPLPPCHTFAFGKGNVGLTAERGIRKVIDDVTTDAQYSQCFIQTASEVVEPILFEGKIVGVIDAEDDKKNAFTDSDLQKLSDLAARASAIFAWTEEWNTKLKVLQTLDDLKNKFPKVIDWIGVYRKEHSELILSCFIGEPTEHVRIPMNRGICGAAVRENQTLNIPDVRQDPRFIACSIKTRSELVVPIRNAQGEAVAEIDIDSNTISAFTENVRSEVEFAAKTIESFFQ